MTRIQAHPPATGSTSANGTEPFAVDVYWPAARIAVLRPCGELDLATVPELAARLDELLSCPPRGLVVDLSGIRFLAVRALGEFVRLHGRAATEPRLPVRLACAPSQVARVLRVSGVGLMFDLHDSVQAAVDSLLVRVACWHNTGRHVHCGPICAADHDTAWPPHHQRGRPL